MKIKYLFLLTMLCLTIFSCRRDPIPGPTGPMGPRGPQGPEGPPGEISYVWEISNVNFRAANNFTYTWYFPDDFVYDTDKAMVYALWEVYEDNFGNPVDVWRPLPAFIFPDAGGTLHYSFDFSIYDVVIRMQAIDTQITPAATDDWVFRIVLLPADWARTSESLDYNDYHAVKERFKLPDLPIPAKPGYKRNL